MDHSESHGARSESLWLGGSLGTGHPFASIWMWGFPFITQLVHIPHWLPCAHFCCFWTPFCLGWPPCWAIAKKEPREFPQLNLALASKIHCLANVPPPSSEHLPQSQGGISTSLYWSWHFHVRKDCLSFHPSRASEVDGVGKGARVSGIWGN